MQFIHQLFAVGFLFRVNFRWALFLFWPMVLFGESAFPLWDSEVPFPESIEAIAPIDGVRYVNVFRSTPKWRFLHQSGIGFHNGVLFVGWVHAGRDEAEPDQVINGRRSFDGGRTWTDLEAIAPALDGAFRWEYCSFLPLNGRMWAITTRARDSWHFRDPVMELFRFDEAEENWIYHGPVLKDFIATDKPRRLANGNWLMAGWFVESYPEKPSHYRENTMVNRVAISDGDDLTTWRIREVPHGNGLVFPFISPIVDGSHVTGIFRNSQATWALVTHSTDNGETWTEAGKSNLPMTAVKPFGGILSDGRRYLVSCTPVSEGDHSREALTIAFSQPGKPALGRILKISRGRPYSLRYEGKGKRPQWSYPKAVEHEGHLYVIYTVNKEDAEMAVIPLEALR
jgi:hypothetical protein